MRQKLSTQERVILQEILQRARDLPFPLHTYIREIGKLREELGIRSRVRAEKPKGFAQTHNVRATAAWS